MTPLATAVRRPSQHFRWLGLVPFIGYTGVFFLLPTGVIVYTAFRVAGGSFGVDNLSAALQGAYLAGLQNSVVLSLVSALLAAVLGFVLAYAITTSPGTTLQRIVSTSAAVLANFGGLPLAFLFIAAIGNAGVLTKLLNDAVGISLGDDLHFDLYSQTGVTFVYLYFLVPLMVLVITPALEGLKVEWREAAENLGASPWHYWRHVAGPVLLPHFIGCVALLFCTSFSSFATADALTNGSLAITPLQISNAVSGNVLVGQENLGSAMAFNMIIVVVPLTVLYQYLQNRTSRWLQ